MKCNLSEKVAEYQRRMEKLKPIIRAAKDMAEVRNRWEEKLKVREFTLEDLSELLSELNYPPVSIDLSTKLLQNLNSQLKELENYNDKIGVLDQFIVGFFNNEYINEKLEVWNDMDCLKDRIHIVEEIIEAHKRELFSLSTLAVFPQIEGILAETFPHLKDNMGKFNGNSQKKALKVVLNTESNKFDGVWSSYYEENILKGFQHLEPIEHLSRHALAHGADKDYGNRVNSTKSLMIFDYIITKVELYRISIEEKDETFPE